MKTIEYERTLNDILNYNLYHFKHSPSLRRQALVGRITGSVLVVVVSLALMYIIDSDKHLDSVAYIFALIGAVISFLIFPWLHTRGIRNRTLKLLNEGSNKGLLGRQRITLQDEGLYCESPSGETKLKWEAIERIVTNEDYMFVYLGSVNAIVIPKRAFASQSDLHAFLEDVQHHASSVKVME